MHLINEVVRASLQSQLHRLTAESRLATANPVSGHLPADRDRHGVGVAEEEIAWRRFRRPHSTKGEDT
jgi:hypothetical protein